MGMKEMLRRATEYLRWRGQEQIEGYWSTWQARPYQGRYRLVRMVIIQLEIDVIDFLTI